MGKRIIPNFRYWRISLIPTNNVVVDITNLYNKCKDLELQIDIITQQINSASQLVSKIEAYQIPNDLPRLGKEIETIKQKKTLLDDTIISLECLIELKDIEEDLILGEFQEIVALEELKTMRLKNVCPNCGAKIDA
jgi:hypothetical protein